MVRIAIDGPGGAGKSSVAKAVAKKLGIIYVDTGALYRTIGKFMLELGVDPKDESGVVSNLNRFALELKFQNGRQVILLNGEDVGDSIRTPEVSMAASAVSAFPAVREYLLNMQRDIARKNSVIMDGRDIGTVILPNAEVKIFLTASAKKRAERRYQELIARGQNVSFENVYDEMAERDKNDSTRAVAPCVPAKDAVMLDNSELDMNETVDAVLKIVKKKTRPKKHGYRILRFLLGGPIRFFQHVVPIGLENIEKDKNYIVCANHIAKRDVVLISAAYPTQLRFIAKKELFSIPFLSWLITKFGAIKLDRGGSDVTAIKTAVKLAKDGETVAIFPQGHRYPGTNPAQTPRKNGAALIAYHSGLDVLPVCIKTKKIKYTPFCKKEIIFGKPIRNESLGFEAGGGEEYRLATDIIFNEILKLGGYDKLLENKNSEK
jgi:cytidylate kinase